MNAMDGSALLMIIIAIIAIGGLLILISNLERYTAFFKALERVLSSIKYALYGCGVVASLGGLYLACVAITAVGSGVGFRLEWLLYATAAYIVLSALGWIAEKAVARATEMHARYVEQQAAVEEPTT
jgi:FtsH-binding integral membrane protein